MNFNMIKDFLYALTHSMCLLAENRDLHTQNMALKKKLEAEISRANENDYTSDCLLSELKELKAYIADCKSSIRNAATNLLNAGASASEIYETVKPVLDSDSFELFYAAEQILGDFDFSYFAYEDNRGYFEEADGHTMLRYLLIQYDEKLGEVNCNKDRWREACSCYEECFDLSIDKTTPEYKDFEAQLYIKVLERLGILTPAETQAKEVAA